MLRDHGLPEEDGVMDFGAPSSPSGELEIVVVAYPRASNLDEFAPLRRVPGARLRWARSAAEAQSSGWIVLPGSKQVSGDLAWLRAQGIDRIVMQHAGADRPVLGICGGLQMLGQRLIDPDGADGEPGVDVPGLGLLPVVTEYRGAKRVRPSTGAFGEMSGPFAALSGLRLGGYEIRVGQTRVVSPDACAIAIADDGEPLAWQRGPVLGSALHGLFEEPPAVRRLFGRDVRGLDVELDRLAEQVGTAFHADALARLLGL
jgi:adenosylcobyric acid synthase